MGNGGLLQISAFGSQNVWLNVNPHITFWKSVYRRHTQFALESIENTFNGSADFAKKVNCLISRNGDMIYHIWLRVALSALTASSGNVNWARYLGHVLINSVEFQIGGSKIDKHYGDWLTIWNELTQVAEKQDAYNMLIGNVSGMYTPASSIAARVVYVPLQFTFNRNAGAALPLIALRNHDVRLEFDFRTASDCFSGTATTPTFTNCTLWVEYVYLDEDERRKYAREGHEYLIEQLQFTGEETKAASTAAQNFTLSFNHPVKFLAWVAPNTANETAKEWANYTDAVGFAGGHTLGTGQSSKFLINGNDRFPPREDLYFGLIQPYEYMPRVPATGIYCYSFALYPTQLQPSGAINLSRIEKAILQLVFTGTAAGKCRIYAFGYNVLRIQGGMGALAYAS